MKNKIINELKDKKVLILGLGLEGYSTYKMLSEDNTLDISLADAKIKDIVVNKNIDINDDKLIDDMDYINLFENFDVIFKTPGISFKGLDMAKYKHKITSQLDMFFKYSNHNTVAITGTKGKSTTTSLLYTVIKNEIDNTFIAGNIGIPIFDQVPNMNDESIVIIEMSSHQLEFINYSPKTAVILNFYEEHLDHYNSYQHYKDAKKNIAINNEQCECFIYNKSIAGECSLSDVVSKVEIDCDNITNMYEFDFDSKINLLGTHNKKNIFFVLNILKQMDLALVKVATSIQEFKPLEHRIEYVGVYDNITFYNDANATIPQAVVSCIESINDITTLIFGGLDRGVDLTDLVKGINQSNLINVICLKETAHKVASSINKNVILVESLEQGVQEVYKLGENQVCAMSPGAASYNEFKNFEEKGNKYKEYINKYSNNKEA